LARKLGNVIYDKKYKNVKIAVTYKNGQIFQYFGHTKHFKVHEIEDALFAAEELHHEQRNGCAIRCGIFI